MSDRQEFKNQARRDARIQRKTARDDTPDAAERAAAVFLNSIEIVQADIVSLYCAIQSELDPAPLVEILRKREVVTCFPVVNAPATPLEFRVATASTRFVPGEFGAAIPEDGAPIVTPTIVIAPLLTFDRRLYRLGYGGGFYDRTLERLRAGGPVRAYGYAYAAQEVETVAIEATDERLDGIVTENGLIT